MLCFGIQPRVIVSPKSLKHKVVITLLDSEGLEEGQVGVVWGWRILCVGDGVRWAGDGVRWDYSKESQED